MSLIKQKKARIDELKANMQSFLDGKGEDQAEFDQMATEVQELMKDVDKLNAGQELLNSIEASDTGEQVLLKVAEHTADIRGTSVSHEYANAEQDREFMLNFFQGIDRTSSQLSELRLTGTPQVYQTITTSTSSGVGGGENVPTYVDARLFAAQRKASAMLDSATIESATSLNQVDFPTVNDTGNDAQNPNQGAAHSSNPDTPFKKTSGTMKRYDSGTVDVSIDWLNSTAIENVENRIYDLLGARIGRKLNTEMTALLASGSNNKDTTAANTTVTFTEFYDATNGLDEAYESDSCIIMVNKSVKTDLGAKTVSTTDLRTVVSPSQAEGMGLPGMAMFNGFKLRTNRDLPAIKIAAGQGAHKGKDVAVVGDFREGFVIRQYTGGITLNRFAHEKGYASKGLVGFHSAAYFAGALVVPEAFHFLKMKA